MTKMTKADLTENIKARVAARQERDAAKLTCQNALRRSRNYSQEMLKADFATTVTTYDMNLDRFFERCDKTLDRFFKVLTALKLDTLSVAKETDQNRYTFNLVRTLIAAHAKSIAMISKDDQLATASKREVSQDYISVAKRIMCDSTAERQTGIAAKVLEDLGFCNVTFNGNKIAGITVNAKSAAFKLFADMIARGR